MRPAAYPGSAELKPRTAIGTKSGGRPFVFVLSAPESELVIRARPVSALVQNRTGTAEVPSPIFAFATGAGALIADGVEEVRPPPTHGPVVPGRHSEEEGRKGKRPLANPLGRRNRSHGVPTESASFAAMVDSMAIPFPRSDGSKPSVPDQVSSAAVTHRSVDEQCDDRADDRADDSRSLERAVGQVLPE